MTELKSRAEMAEEIVKYITGYANRGSEYPGVFELLSRRDEMVIDFVAANFEFDDDNDGIVIDKVSKAIRALKSKLQ